MRYDSTYYLWHYIAEPHCKPRTIQDTFLLATDLGLGSQSIKLKKIQVFLQGTGIILSANNSDFSFHLKDFTYLSTNLNIVGPIKTDSNFVFTRAYRVKGRCQLTIVGSSVEYIFPRYLIINITIRDCSRYNRHCARVPLRNVLESRLHCGMSYLFIQHLHGHKIVYRYLGRFNITSVLKLVLSPLRYG